MIIVVIKGTKGVTSSISLAEILRVMKHICNRRNYFQHLL